jgi:hypothetical protein
MYETLDALEILRTAERLEQRIRERFPDASLSKLAARLAEITRESITQVQRLRRPNVPLRIGVSVLLVAGFVTLGLAVRNLHVNFGVTAFSELMQGAEATLGILFFLGTGVFFFVKIEDRLKRERTLRMVHKLRTVAHIVDMHQLTKDPDAVLTGAPPTASSPKRTLTEVELRRYLDYSCELLALVGKVAALYAEGLADPVVLDAVDDLEDLTAGLIGKIWQKLMMMGRWNATLPKGSGVQERSTPESAPAARVRSACDPGHTHGEQLNETQNPREP